MKNIFLGYSFKITLSKTWTGYLKKKKRIFAAQYAILNRKFRRVNYKFKYVLYTHHIVNTYLYQSYIVLYMLYQEVTTVLNVFFSVFYQVETIKCNFENKLKYLLSIKSRIML